MSIYKGSTLIAADPPKMVGDWIEEALPDGRTKFTATQSNVYFNPAGGSETPLVLNGQTYWNQRVEILIPDTAIDPGVPALVFAEVAPQPGASSDIYTPPIPLRYSTNPYASGGCAIIVTIGTTNQYQNIYINMKIEVYATKA